NESVDRAARGLAATYGIKPEVMRALVSLWIDAKVHQYEPLSDPARIAAARGRFLALLPASGRDPLVLQIVAEGLDMLSDGALGDCPAANFNALIQGSTDVASDAWRIANSAICTDNFARAMMAAPDRSVPLLIRQANYGGVTAPADQLPLLAWLASATGLAHVAEEDRTSARILFTRDYALALFNAGLSERAVALLDSLPPEMRTATLQPERRAVTIKVDELEVSLDGDRPDDALRIALASAYAAADRDAEARSLIASPALEAARRNLKCREIPSGEARCRQDDGDAALLILDHHLNHRGDDPYLVAEYAFGSGGFHQIPVALAEVECRVFSDPQYADICENARHNQRAAAVENRAILQTEATARALAAIDRLALPDLASLRTDLRAALTALGGSATPAPRTRRTSIDPEPPFIAQPLPAAFRGPGLKAASWPKDIAPLPEGYAPVRLDRSGRQVTAISLSQNLDPTGEVTGGGYWVHLSDDGGKHWQAPLYTGLAQAFPYVVPGSSRMPLRDGDTLNLEVEVALIDTATITYPPIGTSTRKREKNLYVRLPLADLRRDTNGDGISDVIAEHLLLDSAPRDGGTPFIVGSEAPGVCRAQPTPEQRAVQAVLRTIFEMPSEAHVTPIDNPPDNLMGALGRPASISVERPLLVEGSPADFACLHTDRLMIVYGKKDIEALQRRTPDFRTVSLPRILYNRARDRGYVVWSAGWTGGTYRLRLANGQWVFDPISSWIT
ncbi:MAG TPA: hypothetical protein VN029_08955, partial [Sphingomonas sp.]|nr:hypothetical protein [Sphingomonas sp.]